MEDITEFIDKDRKIAILGLGYIGLPLALEFSKKFSVIGVDSNKNRIEELNNGFDRTNEISNNKLKLRKNLLITENKQEISVADIFIITVPTPVDKENKPNLDHS